jgi:hypothetical protein
MAASQLTAASDVSLGERLRAIATSAHWRHVFRIAASKIFSVAELGHFRSDVLAICHASDSGDLGDEARLTRAGAKLALDLLLDGIANSAPRFRKQLVRRALALLDIGPSAMQSTLLDHLAPDTQEIFREETVSRLQQGVTFPARAAWSLLIFALLVDRTWAEKVLIENWPERAETVLELAVVSPPTTLTPRLRGKFLTAQWVVGPKKTLEFARDVMISLLRQPDSVRRLAKEEELIALPIGYIDTFRLGRTDETITAKSISGTKHTWLSMEIAPLEATTTYSLTDGDTKEVEAWSGVRALAKFFENPSKQTLAEALRKNINFHDVFEPFARRLPWVLNTILEDHRQGVDLCQLADETANGEFGDTTDWQQAEQRWRLRGIEGTDFLTWNSGRYLSRDIAKIGAPFPLHYSVSPGNVKQDRLESFISTLQSLSSPLKRLGLVEALLFALLHSRGDVRELIIDKIVGMSLDLLTQIGNSGQEAIVNLLLSADFDSGFYDDCRFIKSLDNVGRHLRKSVFLSDDKLSKITKLFNLDPSLRGLLPILLLSRQDRSDKVYNILDETAFEEEENDEVSIQIAVASLRVTSGKLSRSDIPALVGKLLHQRATSLDFRSFGLFKAENMSGHPARSELLTAMLNRASELISVDQPGLAEIMATDLDRRQSPLVEQKHRAILQLPSP